MDSVTSRDILAENLSRLIEASGLSLRAWAQGKGLDVKLVERLAKNSHAVTLDKLEQVAKSVGLEAWHLLIPNVDPANPPSPPITAKDREMLSRLKKMLNEP